MYAQRLAGASQVPPGAVPIAITINITIQFHPPNNHMQSATLYLHLPAGPTVTFPGKVPHSQALPTVIPRGKHKNHIPRPLTPYHRRLSIPYSIRICW